MHDAPKEPKQPTTDHDAVHPGESGWNTAAGVLNWHSGRLLLLGSGYWRRHKGRRYWIDNAAFKDGIDFALGSQVDVPPLDITNWV